MTSTDVQPEDDRNRARPSGPARWRKVLIAVVAVLALLFLGTRIHLLPGFGDLFGEQSHDNTGPTLLQSIQDLNRYEAAEGNFQVVVDLEKNAKYLPSAIRGTRTLYVGAGSVDAFVDFSGVAKGDVTTNADRTTAQIKLPHAQLGKAALDPDRSYTVDKQRGLLDRLGDLFSNNPDDEKAVTQLAAKHITDAAKDSQLTSRAEKNTTAMLQGLLHSLGFTSVTVTYA
jgi:Protein of unknown function (DUF4230)